MTIDSTSPAASQPSLKWRLLARFWAIQFVAAHVLLFVFFRVVLAIDGVSSVRLSDLLDPWAHALVATVTLAVTALQAAMVLPVQRPRPTRSPRPRLFKAAVGSLAFGFLAGSFVILATTALESAQVEWLERVLPPSGWVFWAVVAIATTLALPILLVACRDRVPLALSMTIAAMLASVLAGGGVLALASLVDLLTGYDRIGIGFACAFILLAWLATSPFLIVYARSRRPERAIHRVAGVLFVGTGVELLATIPIDVMIRRRTDCYCGEGTFWTLGFVAGVGLVVAGPAVFLLPLARRRARADRAECWNCGYDLAGLATGSPCPECGSRDGGPVESKPNEP